MLKTNAIGSLFPTYLTSFFRRGGGGKFHKWSIAAAGVVYISYKYKFHINSNNKYK